MNQQILFSRPIDFRVDYQINPYMNSGVDSHNALTQWERIVETVSKHTSVQTVDYTTYNPGSDVPDISERPDSVFCANHALPIPGTNRFILSTMANEERQGEPAYFERWAQDAGYETVTVSSTFEGAGDGKWHHGSDILWLGYGQRTSQQAIREITHLVDARVIPLRLVSPAYYHLDTCFTRLGPETALIVSDAFTADGRTQINAVFDTVHTVPEEDKDTLAGNACLLDDSVVAIEQTNTATIELLEDEGYTVVDVDTSEYRKAGGSIDCLFVPLA